VTCSYIVYTQTTQGISRLGPVSTAWSGLLIRENTRPRIKLHGLLIFFSAMAALNPLSLSCTRLVALLPCVLGTNCLDRLT
jgi:hypothetical protein